MDDRRPDGQVPAGSAGLCDGCAHVQIVTGARGSRFFLCRLSYTDPRFPRYPRLPVLACDGFSPRAGEGGSRP
jgi:hypothetical protein